MTVPGRVSVIIPTFNRGTLLLQTLDSIAVQSWRDFEIIVVDDGSTDDTQARLHHWKRANSQIPVTVIHQGNEGPASARNRGLCDAVGQFVYFIDSDDLAEPGTLAILAQTAIRHKAPYVVGHIRNSDLLGKPVAGDCEGIAIVREGDYFASRWMTHGALYRRETLDRVGPFDVTLQRGEDTEHIWRVIAVCGPAILVPHYLGLRRIHDGGHLSVGRSREEAARDDLRTVSRFLAWARSTDRLDDKVASSALRRTLLSAVRSGFSGDWEGNGRALMLARNLRSLKRPLLSGLWSILCLRMPLIYAPIMIGLELAKWVRDRILILSARAGSGRFTHFYSHPRFHASLRTEKSHV
jgi:glycosyltransferase involved in cell wall biosynthesis